MRLATVELPPINVNDLTPLHTLKQNLADVGADAVLINEMPFAPWFPKADAYNAEQAAQIAADHDRGVAALSDILSDFIVLSSRATQAENRLINQGFSLVDGTMTVHHQKSRLPQEDGWFEQSWFTPGNNDFNVFEINGVRFGFMICTELMFTEYAREYLNQRTDVILVSRATGGLSEKWFTAGKMASVWSGAYVVCANRTGEDPFNGAGFIVKPDDLTLTVTSPSNPVIVTEIDTALVQANRDDYPRYLQP